MIIIMMTIEWFQRHREHGLEISNVKHPAVRYLIYYLLIYVIWRPKNTLDADKVHFFSKTPFSARQLLLELDENHPKTSVIAQ